MATIINTEHRFWSKVQKAGPDDCWEWLGAKYSNGYGHIHLRNPDRNLMAHRFSYALVFGEPTPEFCVLHRCDNRGCVAPHHLFLGTKKCNIQDCLKKGRFTPAKLKESDVAAIKNSDKRGMDLAVEYGVSRSTISRIRTHEKQQHIGSNGNGNGHHE